MNAFPTDEEIELRIREFFEDNYQFLKDSTGHSIDSYTREVALQQVLYYWKKNRELIKKITRSEVKLSLPEQETPKEKIPYTIEGIVDIVQEAEEVWLYDLKTHDLDSIKANITPYKEQLYIYAYIWKNLQGNDLDDTAIIATRLPERLQNAIKNAVQKPQLVQAEMENWDPIVRIGYDEDEVRDMIENFGNVVEKIENSEFSAPPVSVLQEKKPGKRASFGVDVCRNCDVRFSCSSYAEYLKVSSGASRGTMYKYMCARNNEQDEYVDANLRE